MYARSSIDVSPGRWPMVGLDRRSGPIRRVVVILFTVAVEAILVLGFILVTLAPGGDGVRGTGPDRPPAPLAAPHRP
jgi:hypothetical protein